MRAFLRYIDGRYKAMSEPDIMYVTPSPDAVRAIKLTVGLAISARFITMSDIAML